MPDRSDFDGRPFQMATGLFGAFVPPLWSWLHPEKIEVMGLGCCNLLQWCWMRRACTLDEFYVFCGQADVDQTSGNLMKFFTLYLYYFIS